MRRLDHIIGWSLLTLYFGVVALAATLMTMLPARGHGVEYRLEWRFATIIATGHAAARSPERQSFKSMADCAAFGVAHVGRMHDWVRGLIRADWNHPVEVAFDCKPVGDPA